MAEPLPTAPTERVAMLDALRGFAVLGIFLANMLHFTGYFFLSEWTRAKLKWAGSDHAVEFFINVFVDGKFYSLFSLLFGIGFSVLLVRCEATGRSVNRFFSRRLTVLLIIGLVHAALIWMGDILTLYVLVGFALLLFHKRSDRTLMVAAVVLFALPVLQYVIMLALSGTPPPNPRGDAQRAAFFDQMVRLMAQGSIADMMKLNLGALIFGRYPDLLFTGRIFKVLATFLIGLYIGRHVIHVNPAAWRQLLGRVAVLGFVIGLPANITLATLARSSNYERLTPMGVLESAIYAIGVPSLALAYAASFALLWLRASSRLSIFEPAGRTALTNYLLQSVICTFIFKTIGLGLMGQVGVTMGTVLVFVIFALQLWLSHLWLRHFRFGPVEWLWRTLTYGRRQPMRIGRSESALGEPA